jgi:hypothetical protein
MKTFFKVLLLIIFFDFLSCQVTDPCFCSTKASRKWGRDACGYTTGYRLKNYEKIKITDAKCLEAVIKKGEHSIFGLPDFREYYNENDSVVSHYIIKGAQQDRGYSSCYNKDSITFCLTVFVKLNKDGRVIKLSLGSK